MGEIVGVIGAAVGVFAATNIDDIIVLTVLFLSSRATGMPQPWQIWAGQYAGIRRVANGADNISVYTPLFRSIGLTSSLIMVGVFAIGVAAWCLAAAWLGSHK